MERRIRTTLLLIFFWQAAWAQHAQDIWFFREQAGLDFRPGNPVPTAPDQLTTNGKRAVLCDRHTGALRLYTDGETILNDRHEVVATGLGGISHSNPSLVFVPDPADSLRYYLLYSVMLAGDGACGITHEDWRYAHITFSPDGQDVTVVADPAFRLEAPRVEAPGVDAPEGGRFMTAQFHVVPHADGASYWLVRGVQYEAGFSLHLLTATGFGPPRFVPVPDFH